MLPSFLLGQEQVGSFVSHPPVSRPGFPALAMTAFASYGSGEKFLQTSVTLRYRR